MLYFFPTLAYAEGGAGASASTMSSIMSVAPILILFVVFYFLLIRPQQKKAKEHKEMLSKINKGDNIVTTSGIFGKVVTVNDDTVTIEVADNVKIKFAKEAVAQRKS